MSSPYQNAPPEPCIFSILEDCAFPINPNDVKLVVFSRFARF